MEAGWQQNQCRPGRKRRAPPCGRSARVYVRRSLPGGGGASALPRPYRRFRPCGVRRRGYSAQWGRGDRSRYAVVRCDSDGCIPDAARLDHLEDGAARRTAGLAVIARTLLLGGCTADKGIWHVASIKMLLSNLFEPNANIALLLGVTNIGEEARALNFIYNRGDACDRRLPCLNGDIGRNGHLFLRLT